MFLLKCISLFRSGSSRLLYSVTLVNNGDETVTFIESSTQLYNKQNVWLQMETNAIFTYFCRSRINLKLRKWTTAGWFFLLLFLAGNKETALQQKGVKYVVSSPCSLVWLLPSIMCYLVNDWKHKFSWDPLKPYSLFAVKKLLSAAGSSDSLCTWRDRYAGSCAADPGASQNGLSVGKKKEKLRFLYFCQTVRKTDMNVLSLCVSTEPTVYRIWKQK